MKNNKFLVSGATGFIGQALVREMIKQGSECKIVTRRHLSQKELLQMFGSKLVEVILEDNLESFIKSCNWNEFEGVIHLASNYVKEHKFDDIRNLLFANNTLGVLMLETAAKCDAKFLFTSSYFEYDFAIKKSLYITTKKTFQNFVKYFAEMKKIKIIECVLYDTYGPNDTRNKLVNLLLNSSITKEELSIGNPDNYISLTYIDDIVSGIIESLKCTISKKFVLSNCEFLTVRELTELINEQFDIKFHFIENMHNQKKPSVLKLSKPEGWYPKTDLKIGLSKIKKIGVD